MTAGHQSPATINRGASGRATPAASRSLRLIWLAGFALACVVSMGTLAFRLAADEPWNEAFFRSLSAFTPSSMVPEAQTPGERTITAVLVLTALVFYLLAIGTAVQEVGRRLIDEDLQDRRERRTMERLKDHYIVCGYGNVGRAVVAALVAKGDRVAVIDNSPENLAEARRRRVDTVLGRASDDAVLERAGIATAAALVACVGSDAENLYILLAAKRARPGVRLVARASDSTNRESLKRAVPELDATSPYEAAGQELADLARAPAQAPSPPRLARASESSHALEWSTGVSRSYEAGR